MRGPQSVTPQERTREALAIWGDASPKLVFFVAGPYVPLFRLYERIYCGVRIGNKRVRYRKERWQVV